MKCMNCKYSVVVDRDYYDADNVRRTDIKYICQLTGVERELMRERECPNYKERGNK